MKKLAPLAFVCAALVSTSAMALQEGQDRAVRISGFNAGTLTPFLAGPGEGGVLGRCPYSLVWVNEAGTDSVECVINERKVVGHSSCFSNAQEDFDTTLAAGGDIGHPTKCQAYDMLGRLRDVAILWLGESEDGDEVGMVLFPEIPTGAYSIRLI